MDFDWIADYMSSIGYESAYPPKQLSLCINYGFENVNLQVNQE